MPRRRARMDALGFLAMMIGRSGRSREDIARAACLESPDFLDKVFSGKATLSLEEAAAVFEECVPGDDPAPFVGLMLAYTHPKVWAELQDHPHALLGPAEREMVRLYWRAEREREVEITPQRRRLILEALGVPPEEIDEPDEREE